MKIHQKRMHKDLGIEFPCTKCGINMKTAKNRSNHERTCGGSQASNSNLRRCEYCGREYSKSNIARHRAACTAKEKEGGGETGECRPTRSARQERTMSRVWTVEVGSKHGTSQPQLQERQEGHIPDGDERSMMMMMTMITGFEDDDTCY